jgi:transcriptional regulator with XRE-family HTH domain
MSSAEQERSRRLAANYRSGMALDELRQAREMTQVHLAKILRVNQAAVSKIERRADMYVNTLQDFVKAMGGELKITAKSGWNRRDHSVRGRKESSGWQGVNCGECFGFTSR